MDTRITVVESGVMTPPPALCAGAREQVAMTGVCAMVDAHPGLVRELRKALAAR